MLVRLFVTSLKGGKVFAALKLPTRHQESGSCLYSLIMREHPRKAEESPANVYVSQTTIHLKKKLNN